LRTIAVGLIWFGSLAACGAQEDPRYPTAEGWRAPGSGASDNVGDPTLGPRAGAALTPAPLDAVGPTSSRPVAKVTKGTGTLPNDHGQVWREYDISPYTLRVTSTNRPEQAIVDWILRETGYESWHSEPLGLLSANKRTLRVYHTPEIQSIVQNIVDRFVSSEAETEAFGLRIITINNPNWRAKAMRLMKPVPVQSQGVQGWLMAKENASLLLAEMGKRSDFREHSSPHLLVNNGQSTIVSSIRPRTYVRGVSLRDGAWPGYAPEVGQVEEGYALEFSPLMSLDGGTVDAIVKVRLAQVEKMVPVMLEVPTSVAPRQRTQIEVPQVTMCNLHERFRWPSSHVLLLSMGVVATPAPGPANPLAQALPIASGPARADALLFIENKGKIVVPAGSPANPQVRSAGAYPGRY
jgi:hypothetical protein